MGQCPACPVAAMLVGFTLFQGCAVTDYFNILGGGSHMVLTEPGVTPRNTRAVRPAIQLEN